MTDTFERFPPEIIVEVMEELPDLVSLYALIRASPTAKALYDGNPGPLMNLLIEKSMPKELHRHINWIAIMLSLPRVPGGPYSADSLQGFIERFRALGGTETSSPALLHDLRGTDGPREALVSAVLVERLHNVCLDRMLTHICSIEDGHPAPPTFTGADFTGHAGPGARPIIPVPEQSFFGWASWTPSWVERFRVKEAI